MISSTIYNLEFKKKPYSKRTLKVPDNNLLESLPEDGLWLEGELDISSSKHEEIREKINRMYRLRNVSTYQKEICHKLDEKNTDEHVFPDQMRAYGIRTFTLEDRYLLPPIGTSRVIFGYMNPKNFRTGKTAYETDYCFRGLKTLYPNLDFQGRSELQDRVLKEWRERQVEKRARRDAECKEGKTKVHKENVQQCGCLLKR